MTCLKITQWMSRLSYTGVRLNEFHILSETLCIRVSDLHIIVERNASPQKTAAPTTPESLLDMHILELHPRPSVS